MPAFPSLHQRRDERPQRVHHTKKVDVDDPPPVVRTGVQKGPRNRDTSVGHDQVWYPDLTKNPLSKPLCGSAVSNIKLKSNTLDVPSGPFSRSKIDVNTDNIGPLLSKRDGSGSPNPATSAGNEGKLAFHGRARPNLRPLKLPRRGGTPEMVDELAHESSNGRGPPADGPVLSANGPPPKVLTPRISGSEDGRRDVGVPGKRKLLNRHAHTSGLSPPAPKHIGPIKLKPVTSVPIPSLEPPPQQR